MRAIVRSCFCAWLVNTLTPSDYSKLFGDEMVKRYVLTVPGVHWTQLAFPWVKNIAQIVLRRLFISIHLF